MSVKLMAQVWDLTDPELNNSRLLTLLALADHANADNVCWPSIPSLAQRARVSDRQAQRNVEWLCTTGYLEILTRGNGRGNPTYYRLTIKGDTVMSPISVEKGDKLTPIEAPKGDIVSPINDIKGDIFDIKGDIAMSPESLREPSEEEEKSTEFVKTQTLPPVQPKPVRAKRQKPAVHPNTKPIVTAYEQAISELEPGARLNYGRESAAAKELAKLGHSPEDVVACFQWLKLDKFWASKHVSLQTVGTQIGAWKSTNTRKAALNGNGTSSGNFNSFATAEEEREFEAEFREKQRRVAAAQAQASARH